MLDLIAFKAGDGDCFLIRHEDDEGQFSILWDAGRAGTPALVKKYLLGHPDDLKKIDLFVISHIDADHVEGALEIARDPFFKQAISSVWFNAKHHAKHPLLTALSPAQGDILTEAIRETTWSWNAEFGASAVVRRPEHSNTHRLAPSITLRLLGPDVAALKRLSGFWESSLRASEKNRRGHLVPMGGAALDVEQLARKPYARDTSIPNASSICALLSCGSYRILLASDAHAESLSAAIWRDFEGRLDVDIATLPHHGSKANISMELANLITCRRWIVSTNGVRHNHPDPEAISRVLLGATRSRELEFVFNSNHREAFNWSDALIERRYRYSTRYAVEEDNWIEIRIGSSPTI